MLLMSNSKSVKPEFNIIEKDKYWSVEIFWYSYDRDYEFKETFSEEIYQKITDWCNDTFKTWLYPKRVRRMSYNTYYFSSKRDLDWFILNWSGVDIQDF